MSPSPSSSSRPPSPSSSSSSKRQTTARLFNKEPTPSTEQVLTDCNRLFSRFQKSKGGFYFFA
jgi:hypothetical protein